MRWLRCLRDGVYHPAGTWSPAAWKKPREGFGVGCATWCGDDATIGVGPDNMFAIVTDS